MSNILLTMLGIILAENLVFIKLFGVSPFIKESDKPIRAVTMGAAMTAVMTVTSLLTYAVYRYALVPLKLQVLKTVVFVVIIGAVAFLGEAALKRYTPRLKGQISVPITATVSCATLGAALLSVKMHSSVADSVLFGLAAGLGFTLAIVIFAGVREKLLLADPPKAFKGYPILLIAAGLVALAFSGFVGIRFS